MDAKTLIQNLKAAGLKAEKIRALAVEQYEEKIVTEAMRAEFPDYVHAPVAPVVTRTDSVSKDIAELCMVAGCGERAAEYITKGSTLEAVRAELVKINAERNTSITAQVQVRADESDKFRQAAAAGLMIRAGAPVKELATIPGIDQARKEGFASFKLVDLARETLSLEGQLGKRMRDDETVKRALGLSSGNFTSILANVATKFLGIGYGEADTTYQLWTGTGSLSDFKTATVGKISNVASLVEIPEGAPLQNLNLVDDKETTALKTYGGTVNLSRQAIINDDLGAFTRVPRSMAMAARRNINSLVYAELNNNAAMNDSVALFYSTHANLGSTAVISNTTIAEMVKLIGVQTDPNSVRLNLRPTFFLVPRAKEAIALAYLNANVPFTVDTSANTSVYRGQFTVISDAALDANSATAYYMACNPNTIDTVTVFYRNGQDMPILEQEESRGQEALGVTFRILHDVAAKVIDYRGLCKNIGA